MVGVQKIKILLHREVTFKKPGECMGKITITREKQFVGCKMKCWVILNMAEDDARKYIYRAKRKIPNQSNDVIPIANKQSITIELNQKTNFFIAGTAAFGSDKIFYSNKVFIDEDFTDKSYILKIFLNTYLN